MINTPTELGLLNFFRKNKRWWTLKEIIIQFGITITPTEQVKFNRKIRQLIKRNKIDYRVCTRKIAWRHENEYKIVNEKKQN